MGKIITRHKFKWEMIIKSSKFYNTDQTIMY